MPQVNVYIPDDLAEMLPRYREAINLSQICAQAMRQAIQKLEAANQPPGRVNTQRVLDRLFQATASGHQRGRRPWRCWPASLY